MLVKEITQNRKLITQTEMISFLMIIHKSQIYLTKVYSVGTKSKDRLRCVTKLGPEESVCHAKLSLSPHTHGSRTWVASELVERTFVSYYYYL